MRILLILLLGFLFQTTSLAQIDSEEWQRVLEKMQKEMREQMRDFSYNFKDFHFEIDTLFFEHFNLPEGFEKDGFIMPDDIDMSEMMKMLERSFSQMDIEGMMKLFEENFNQMDWSELEKMFEPFRVPAPENLKEGEKKKNKSSKKKKKTYSL